jgi:hypothetical protein
VTCPNCGTANPDTASICANCARPLTGVAPQPAAQSYVPPPPPPRAPGAAVPAGAAVSNYLIPSIFVTLCCCLPFGIVAIIYAAQVNTKLAAGDVAGAMQASRNARMWMLIGAITGVAAMILWIVLAGGSAFVEGFREGMAQ